MAWCTVFPAKATHDSKKQDKFRSRGHRLRRSENTARLPAFPGVPAIWKTGATVELA